MISDSVLWKSCKGRYSRKKIKKKVLVLMKAKEKDKLRSLT